FDIHFFGLARSTEYVLSGRAGLGVGDFTATFHRYPHLVSSDGLLDRDRQRRWCLVIGFKMEKRPGKVTGLHGVW
ncbi:MAG: hypothetical protein MK161_13785, partial [Pirellulales bacterium]|nr:hypothetical protein [Pirellulales bacterium]